MPPRFAPPTLFSHRSTFSWTSARTPLAVLLVCVLPASASAFEWCRCGYYSMADKTTQGMCNPPEPNKTIAHEWASLYCCEDHRKVFSGLTAFASGACGQPASRMGEIVTNNCDFNACTPLAEETICNGIDDDTDGLVDEGCADTDCSKLDGDEHPVRFSSGRVETQPIVPFSLPAPGDTFFGVKVRWGSHSGHFATAQFITNGSAVDYYGLGVVDIWSDRLSIAQPRAAVADRFPAQLDWESFSTPTRFLRQTLSAGEARYTSNDARHELIATSDGLYRVIDRRQHAERTFRALSYTMPTTNKVGMLGLLIRVRTGGYTIDISRDPTSGRIQSLTDSLGRSLAFEHEQQQRITRVKAVHYGAPGQPPTLVARFVYAAHDPAILIRIEDGRGGYTRLRMVPPPPESVCLDCRGLVAEVIEKVRDGVPGDAFASSGLHERIVEGHNWSFSAEARPLASGSYGPLRRWAYRDVDPATCASTGNCRRLQIDLLTRDGACTTDADCTAGDACHMGGCRDTTMIEYDGRRRQVLAHHTSDGLGDLQLRYDAAGRLQARFNGNGVWTTYSYAADGSVACEVINDDDTNAGQPPTCNAPPGAFVRAVTVNGLIETERSTGTLPGSGGVISETERDVEGRIVRKTVTGYTRDLDGAAFAQTKTERRRYDSLGRLIEVTRVDEPGYVDRTIYTFHPVGAGYNTGQRFEVIEENGPPAAPRRQVTRYTNYDAYGEPLSVTRPDGVAVTRVLSADRRVLTETANGETWREATHFDGQAWYEVDAAGDCRTYETQTGARIVQRSRDGSPSCGALPIDTNQEEVEIEWTTGLRPADVTGRSTFNAGSLLSEQTYVVDNRGRRRATVIDGVTVSRLDLAPNGDESISEGSCPGPACISSRRSKGPLGQLSALARRRSDGQELRTSFLTTGLWPLPTVVTRSFGTAPDLVSAFVVDDFGRLVESKSPDAAPVRTAYGADDRVLAVRRGVGTGDVATARHEYDALRRLTGIDHDVEHPVSCATAPGQTPISDVEFVFDGCPSAPAGFSCDNALNRVAIERSLLECRSGKVWSRDEYFKYDANGRIVGQAVAFALDGVIIEWLPARHTLAPGGAYSSMGNPAGPSLGTTLGASTVDPLRTYVYSTDSLLLGLVQHSRRGGSLARAWLGSRYRTTVERDNRGLTRARSFLDTATGTAHLNAVYQYDAAGRQTARVDAANVGTLGASRYLTRDAIGRLTCEDGDDAACASAEFEATYTDEAVDQRSSQTHRPPYFSATGGGMPSTTQQLAYSFGTARLSSAADATFQYDGLGRRTSETRGGGLGNHRVFRYLPNGRLGSIVSGDVSAPSDVAISYDARGRAVRVFERLTGTTDDFFFGPDGELIGARRAGVDAPMRAMARFTDGAFLSVFSDGTWSLGVVGDLAATAPRQPLVFPWGPVSTEVVGLAVDVGTREVIFYFAGGYGFKGRVANSLGRLAFTMTSLFSYSLAPGRAPSEVVDVERDPQNGSFVAWYTNGTFSRGTFANLASTAYGVSAAMPLGLRGIAMELSSKRSTTWAYAEPGAMHWGTPGALVESLPVAVPAPVGAAGPQAVGFHRVAGELVALTRQAGPRTQRFYVVLDEQGVVQKAVDESGTVHADVHTSAFGRTTSRLPASLWLPFALPGQLVLERTRTSTNPPLALNGARTYDPAAGRFLEPDPEDFTPREAPEGYTLARHDPTYWSDPTGTVSFAPGQCAMQAEILSAITQISTDILRCNNEHCSRIDKARLLFALWSTNYYCNMGSLTTPDGVTRYPSDIATSYPEFNATWVSPKALRNERAIYAARPWPAPRCANQSLAHEALHLMHAQMGDPDNPGKWNHDAINGYVQACVRCPR